MKLWVMVLIGCVLAAVPPALALTGARQGCLLISNFDRHDTVIMHVRAASKDGDYQLKPGETRYLNPDTLRVSEDSTLSVEDLDYPAATMGPFA